MYRAMSFYIEKLRMSLEELSREDFAATVEAIVGARRIYILGARSSSALAGRPRRQSPYCCVPYSTFS